MAAAVEQGELLILTQIIGILDELSHRMKEIEAENDDLREETLILRAEVAHLTKQVHKAKL